MVKKLTTIVFLFIFSAPNVAKADWPVGKKRFNLSPTINYISSSRYFDADGKVRTSDNNGIYTTNTIGLYGATGLTRRLDLYFNIPATFIVSSDIYSRNTKAGIGDLTVGLAFHTPSDDLKSYFTIKAQVMVPAYSNVTAPYLGYGSKGIQLGANYSFLPRQGNFASVEASVARYFDDVDGPTQVSLGLNYGFQLPKFQLLIFNYNHLNSMSSNKIFSQNLNSNKDFMIGRLSCAYGKRISRTVTPYIQAAYPIYGRNVGQGIGFFLFFSIRLP